MFIDYAISPGLTETGKFSIFTVSDHHQYRCQAKSLNSGPYYHGMNSPVSLFRHLCGQALCEDTEESTGGFADYMNAHPDLLINF